MSRLSSVFVVVVLATATAIAIADETPIFQRMIFDGTSLDGWTVEGNAEFEIVDKQLLLKSGLGWLRADHPVRDFVLKFSWKNLKKTTEQSEVGLDVIVGRFHFDSLD